ncbi:hypothetical protein AAVH_37173, partial [Aphelenchoides avenae]
PITPICPPEGGTWSEWKNVTEPACIVTASCGLCGVQHLRRTCPTAVDCPCDDGPAELFPNCGEPTPCDDLGNFPFADCCQGAEVSLRDDGLFLCVP